MSKPFKIGGRYGMRSGSVKWKNLEIIEDYKGRTMITMGCGPVMSLSAFPFDTTSNTEQTAALCKVYDATNEDFQNLATSATGDGYSNNYQIFTDAEAVNDAIYFGYASKFGCMYIDMSATVAVYSADAVVWEYWNGDAWSSFTPYDETDTDDQDGDRPFQGDGYIILNVGDGWGTCDVDSQNAYWIRCRVATAATISTIPLTNSKEHQVTTLTNGGTVVNTYGTIGRGLFRFETASTGTADTKVILVNMSLGHSSSASTITKAVKDSDISDFNVKVERGNSIAFFCTQVDGGGQEFTGGTCELAIDHS